MLSRFVIRSYLATARIPVSCELTIRTNHLLDVTLAERRFVFQIQDVNLLGAKVRKKPALRVRERVDDEFS